MTGTPDPELIARARNPERGPDGRLLSLRDAVEISIFRPAASAARGDHRAELLRRRDAAVADLGAADQELAALVLRRRALVDRIRDCNLAITGTGEKRDHVTGETLQVLGNWVRRIPFDDVQPVPPGGRTPTVVSGARLRVLVIDLLDAVGAPMSPPEIERLLRLQGVVPAGRPSQTIANALRPAVRDGRVTVVERGWYEAS